MNDIAIRVDHLGKRYRIGEREQYKALRDALARAAAAPFHRLRSRPSQDPREDTIWALKDVSLEVKRGETLGIIGRNGAGKSTLLKILSRITRPTCGYADIRGRVGSLLEVGTGFHPELTGRENIYLNGAILGMKRAEIARKFDEIVDFAEVEKFLDTPVKRYSSGMFIRLAFAVAAHLETEILLVDEVLAVGDVAFQRKCLGKMGDVAQTGRTVLFVSHNMHAVQRLCSRACLVSHGQISMEGDARVVAERYLAMSRDGVSARFDLDNAAFPGWQRRRRGSLRFSKCVVLNPRNEACSILKLGEPLTVHLELLSDEKYEDLDIGVGIDTADEVRITTVRNIDEQCAFRIQPGTPLRLNVSFPGLVLQPGTYSLSVFAHSGKFASDIINRFLRFDVSEITFTGVPPAYIIPALIRTESSWKLSEDYFGIQDNLFHQTVSRKIVTGKLND